MECEKVKFSAFVIQTVATFAISCLTTLTGFVFAWPSYTLENFVSNQTELSRPMTTAEVSILGSLTNAGALIVVPFCGYVMNRLGRKYGAMLYGLPSVEAAKSIAFYRRVDVSSKEVEAEIRKIKLQLDPNIDKILQATNDVDPEAMKELLKDKPSEETQAVSSWKFLMNSGPSKRILFTSLNVMLLTSMMGALVVQVYAEPLFKKAVPSMHSNTCSILLAIDLLVASLICALIIDRFGRKFLLTYTSIGTGLLIFLLATQLQLQFAPHWLTALLIYSYNFIYNLGAATVPLTLIAEAFLPEVRGLCCSIVLVCMWASNFVSLAIFIPLVERFGLGPMFYGFAVISFLTALYSHLCLPETKGLSADAIQLLFLKKEKRVKRGLIWCYQRHI